jgi:hypothetical protein
VHTVYAVLPCLSNDRPAIAPRKTESSIDGRVLTRSSTGVLASPR